MNALEQIVKDFSLSEALTAQKIIDQAVRALSAIPLKGERK